MFYCSNPGCLNPFNPTGVNFCLSCGSQQLSPLFRNRYRVIRMLGEGGFGRTYEARDIDRMDDPCVIKQFVPQFQGTAALDKATELFKQEAQRLYELGEHPQIPRLIAYFQQDKRLYLVQEFVEGQTLKAELRKQGAFSEQKIRQILIEMLPILKLIHAKGVIHRDIKPDNIMRRCSPAVSLTQQGGGDLVLIDFGVSKQATGNAPSESGTVVGTPGYAPVEQIRGQACPASDLYGLGITCICLITGCLPERDGSHKLYEPIEDRWRWRENLPPGTSVSQNLGQVLDKLIAERLKDRFQSAEEVLQLLTDDLSSAVGLDYFPLRDLLAESKWKQAEEETKGLILKVARREKQGWLTGEDFKNFSRTDYRTISQLWNKYSNGRYAQVPASLLQALTDDLSSAVGVDYLYLRELLAAGNWKDADAETVNVMLQAVGRKKEGWIDLNSIKRFPCIDLATLNRLWVKYSNGHFGFSVQKAIWESLGGNANSDSKTYAEFCDRIGWYNKGDLFYYSNLTFDLNAPKGHLPSGRAGDIALLVRVIGKFGGFGVERITAIVAKLEECNIK